MNLNETMHYLFMEIDIYKTVVKVLIGPRGCIQIFAFIDIASTNVKDDMV